VPAATGAALLPLALHQRHTGRTAGIAATSLFSRVDGTVDQFLFGQYPVRGWLVLALSVLVVAAAASAFRWTLSSARRADVLVLSGVAAAGFLLPLLFADDVFLYRNLIVVLPALLLLAGPAFAPHAGRGWGVAAGVCVALLLLAPTVAIARRTSLQREDWRGVAASLGRPDASRAVLTYPQWEYVPLTYYRPGLEPLLHGTVRVRELVVVGRDTLGTLDLPDGFRVVDDAHVGSLRMIRLRAATPRRLDVGTLHLRPLFRPLQQSHSLADAPGQDATFLVERPAANR
jgi:hypothetical protein